MTVTTPGLPKLGSEFPLRPIEVISVLAAVGLVVANAVRFAGTADVWVWTSIIAVVAALFTADFVSGMYHWAGDTWGDETTPVVGPRFIKPFRFHHAHPLDMLKSNFFTTNGDTALAGIPFLIGALFMPLDVAWGAAGAVYLWAVGGWGMWTSQFHLWAHVKHPPKLVRLMQRTGLILGRGDHFRHHKSPFAVNYCITNGWCNPILTRIRFFPALEWTITKLTGLKPRTGPLALYAKKVHT